MGVVRMYRYVWLVGGVVRRYIRTYIDILILLFPTPLVLVVSRA